jgi:hypothetical protein
MYRDGSIIYVIIDFFIEILAVYEYTSVKTTSKLLPEPCTSIFYKFAGLRKDGKTSSGTGQ